MTTRLVTIARFAHAAEAHAARNRLERAGILAVVSDETVANLLSYIGSAVGGVRLQVGASDAQRAGEVLLGLADHELPDDLKGYWRCRDCQQIVDPGFDVCWSCSRSRDEVADPDFRPSLAVLADEMDDESAERPPCFELLQPSHESKGVDGRNPYAPSGIPSDAAPRRGLTIAPLTNRDELAIRAWRASVLGLFLLPPLLHLYSMYLLVRASLGGGELSRRANRRFYGALLINLLVGLVTALLSWVRWPALP
jgi:hypothetical protein